MDRKPLVARSRRGPAIGRSLLVACRGHLSDVEVAIGTVRNHGLTRLKMKLGAVEMHRHEVGFERHQVGDASNIRIGDRIRPCRQTRVTDGVIAAEPFLWAEGLEFHGSEG